MGEFEILWCEYLWAGCLGGPPPRKFRNMNQSLLGGGGLGGGGGGWGCSPQFF